MPNVIWTHDQDAAIRRDAMANVPVRETAARIGRPVPATYTRRLKLGIVNQPKVRATALEAETVRAMVTRDPPASDPEIALALGWTPNRVRHYTRELGLTGLRPLGFAAAASSPSRAAFARVRPDARPEPREVAPARALAPAAPPGDAAPTRTAAKGAGIRLSIGPDVARANAERAALLREQKALFDRLRREAVAAERAEAVATAKAARVAAREAARAAAAAEVERAKAYAARERDAARLARDQCLLAARDERERARAEARGRAAARVEARAVASRVRKASPATPPVRAPAAPGALASGSGRAVAAGPVVARRSAPVVLATPAAPAPATHVASAAPTWGRSRVFRPKPKGPAMTHADAIDLAAAAGDAVARFIAERGVTRVAEETPADAAVRDLRRRGCVVLGNAEDGWTVDGRAIATLDDLLARAGRGRAA